MGTYTPLSLGWSLWFKSNLYSYGAVLIAALYWSSIPRPPRIPKTYLQPNWNSVDD